MDVGWLALIISFRWLSLFKGRSLSLTRPSLARFLSFCSLRREHWVQKRCSSSWRLFLLLVSLLCNLPLECCWKLLLRRGRIHWNWLCESPHLRLRIWRCTAQAQKSLIWQSPYRLSRWWRQLVQRSSQDCRVFFLLLPMLLLKLHQFWRMIRSFPFAFGWFVGLVQLRDRRHDLALSSWLFEQKDRRTSCREKSGRRHECQQCRPDQRWRKFPMLPVQ